MRRPKMSRSVRTPASRPLASVTNTESPVPVRWIARRQAETGVPGPTVTGSRRPTTMSGWDARAGTRAATARSVRSATLEVYAEAHDRAVGASRAPSERKTVPPPVAAGTPTWERWPSAQRGSRRRELGPCAGDREPDVRPHADEREALRPRARGRRAVPQEDSGALAVVATRP